MADTTLRRTNSLLRARPERLAPRVSPLSRRSLLGLAAALALSLAGCGGAGGAQSTVVTQATGSGPATLRIANVSNEPVYYIHMSPTSQNTWGEDLLGSQVLQQGEVFTISNIGAGNWDIRVVDQSGNRKEWYNQLFEAGGSYEVMVDSEGWLAPDGQH